ncbi:MAG: hypothetical protein IPJ69_09140 [Deltaproteobacteria bacterium]|nr:MAG: hypothetical protein IPJ69_09140 [Deltaproteobacteria bacterium]
MNSFSVKQYNQEVTQLFGFVARTAVLAQPSQGLTSTITAPQVSLPSQTETLIRASQKSLQTIVGQMGDFSQKLPADWQAYVNSAVHPVVTEGATPTVNQVNLAIEVLKAVGYLPVNRSDVMAYGAFLETTFKNERFNPCQVMFVGALQSLKANTLLPDFFSRPIALIGSALAITTSVYVLYDNLGEELRVNLLGLADEMTRLVPQAIAKESAQGMSREEAAKVFRTLASRGMLGSLAASAAPVVPEVSEEEKSLSVPISSRPSLLNDFSNPLKIF